MNFHVLTGFTVSDCDNHVLHHVLQVLTTSKQQETDSPFPPCTWMSRESRSLSTTAFGIGL